MEKLEHMFLGQYRHSFDEKKRLTVPSRYRDLIAEGAYITRGFDKNLMVLTRKAFQKLYDHLNELNITDQTSRLLRRMILGYAQEIEIDKSGRILISQALREFANLDGEAIILGQGDYFEIWTPSSWDQQEDLLQDTDANSQRFSALNLATR